MGFPRLIVAAVLAGLGSLGAAAPPAPFQDLTVDQALAKAGQEHRVVLIDFYTTWCGPCKMLDNTTWKDPKVLEALNRKVIALKIDAEGDKALSAKYGVQAYPTILLLRPDGSILDRIVGFLEPEPFLAAMNSSLRGVSSLERLRKLVAETDPADVETQVYGRQQLARVLVQEKLYPEALQEYLWLYDDGMVRADRYQGVRNSFLLGDWQRLARIHPPALDALRQHRDAARARFLAAPETAAAAADLAALNRTLREDAATLATYDQLPASSPGRRLLGAELWDDLIGLRRYADALQGRPAEELLKQIDQLDEFAHKHGSDPRLLKSMQEQCVGLAAAGMEALAGLGRGPEAGILARRAVAIEPSAETRKALEEHLQRSGQALNLQALLAAPGK